MSKRIIGATIALACLFATMVQAQETAAQKPAEPGDKIQATAENKTITIMDPGKDQAEDADVIKVRDAIKEMLGGKTKAALDPLTEVIEKYEAKYGHSDDLYFSARGTTDGLLYAMLDPAKGGKRKVIVLGPAWAMAYWGRGYIYGEMNQFDDEIRELKKALALAPMDAQYQSELGFAYGQKRDFKASLEAYESAVGFAEFDADPEHVKHLQCVAYRGQGFALVELRRFDEAEKAYKACLKITPNEPKSLGELEYIKQQRAR
ncbi:MULTISPECIES: tetratricopeptide repeat protein [Dyella]|uniref:Uncharacterized protein n=2 Tax=Dyella TaxID=231454 RepID=A0A4R0YYI0_9GAMM|nr:MULTISPECIES: tetratricopeptide repeat protein [Dyella]TBR40044.1 hypothetical protein EYV96_07645 [Dyella terrae]TCI12374.1 hypothetical protein EZM97_03225 [Dyella soli]